MRPPLPAISRRSGAGRIIRSDPSSKPTRGNTRSPWERLNRRSSLLLLAVGQKPASVARVSRQRDHSMALFRRLKTPFMEDLPDGEAASPFGPRSAGDLLRQQREALGLDLDDVAAALKIKAGYLAALEAGRPDLLPGPAYAIGFVRAFGYHLGLAGNEILRRFKAESAVLDAKPDLAFPMPLGERSIPGGAMLLVALILALCGYGTWYYVSTSDRSRPVRVIEVPPELAATPPRQLGGEPPVPPATEPQLATTPDTATPAPGSDGFNPVP